MSDLVTDLLAFIDRSPTPYHAVAESVGRLQAAGFHEASESEVWDLSPGDARYVVRNEGSLGVPAGIEVNLYEGTDATGTLIGPEVTTDPLLPGEFVVFMWTVPAPGGEPKNYYVAVDGADDSTSAVTECNEGNNDAATVTVACPDQG